MSDAKFTHPRLAAIYDPMEGERLDLDAYLAMAREFDARHVIDIGCGTGTLAVALARRGVEVTAVDPAESSVDIARTKPDGDRVRWILGTTDDLPALEADLATMTGNVAQVFLSDDEWHSTLRDIHNALRPGGRLVFETRDPRQRAWREWIPAESHRRTTLPGIGEVETWCDLLEVAEPFVTFHWTYRFIADGLQLRSTSTLRFRDREEVRDQLVAAGFEVDEVRDAPDRPGREFVFVARRSEDERTPG